jgi:hypothetical protein
MSLSEQVIEAYPELKGSSSFRDGTILLQDDSDGEGVYIREWNYSQPLPDGLTIGK